MLKRYSVRCTGAWVRAGLRGRGAEGRKKSERGIVVSYNFESYVAVASLQALNTCDAFFRLASSQVCFLEGARKNEVQTRNLKMER